MLARLLWLGPTLAVLLGLKLGCSDAPLEEGQSSSGGLGGNIPPAGGGAGSLGGNGPLGGALTGGTPTSGTPVGTGGTPPLGTGGQASGPPPISCDIRALLSTCTSSICHSSERREGDLALDQVDPLGPAMAAELIGAPASYSGVEDFFSCPAERELRVDPADISNSLLIKKVEGRMSCGKIMPDAEELPVFWLPENREASVQCLREWLLNLVLNNP